MSGASAIIVAAGAGKRFGEMKQFAYLRAKPVLEWTLERFETHAEVDAVVLVLPRAGPGTLRMRYPKIVDIVRGGEKLWIRSGSSFRLLSARAEVVRPRWSPALAGADLIS
jgi:2-C-methyl-D-erythritol 4-phosphate cytidylyltransferase